MITYFPSQKIINLTKELGTKRELPEWRQQRDGAEFVYEVSLTDEAKIIRAALKEVLPNHPYSVRVQRYAGGSSIDASLKSHIGSGSGSVRTRYNFNDQEAETAYGLEKWFQKAIVIFTQGGDPDGEWGTKKHSMGEDLISFEAGFVSIDHRTY